MRQKLGTTCKLAGLLMEEGREEAVLSKHFHLEWQSTEKATNSSGIYAGWTSSHNQTYTCDWSVKYCVPHEILHSSTAQISCSEFYSIFL